VPVAFVPVVFVPVILLPVVLDPVVFVPVLLVPVVSVPVVFVPVRAAAPPTWAAGGKRVPPLGLAWLSSAKFGALFVCTLEPLSLRTPLFGLAPICKFVLVVPVLSKLLVPTPG
jgi:hypothetical protein